MKIASVLPLLSVAAVLAMAVGGCGGPPAQDVGAAPASASAAAPAPPSVSAPPAQPAVPALSQQAFCDQTMKDFWALTSTQLDAKTREDSETVNRKGAAVWSKAASVAPAEVKPDIQRIADSSQQIADRTVDEETGKAAVAEPYEHFKQYCGIVPKR